ncbi:hypothetical protein BKA93DRAFT_822039 [Sparassis latifolia]
MSKSTGKSAPAAKPAKATAASESSLEMSADMRIVGDNNTVLSKKAVAGTWDSPTPEEFLTHLGESLKAPPLERCIIRFLQDHQESGNILASRVTKSFKDGGMPESKVWGGADAVTFARDDELLDGPMGGYRNEGVKWASFGAPITFWHWPLGTSDMVSGSWCWEVTGNEDGDWDDAALTGLLTAVGAMTAYATRRLFKNGHPSKVWVVRVDEAGDDKGVDHTINGLKFTFHHRCALCGRGPPWVSYHDHVQCPLMGTMNKVREHLGYEPMHAEDGCVIRKDALRPMDVEKEYKELRKTLEDLEKRVKQCEQLIETLQGKKRKGGAAPDADAPPSKKQKKNKDASKEEKKAGPSKPKPGKGGGKA